MKWKTLNREVVLDARPFFTLTKEEIESPSGKKLYPWYKIYDADFVVIVPITENNEIVMIEQYRHGAEKYSLEVPAGALDDGESAIQAAERELLEETGYKGAELKLLGKPICEDAALKTNSFAVYLAVNAKKVSEQNLDPGEDIQVVLKPFPEAIRAALDGTVIGTPSIVAILWAAFTSGQAQLL